MRSYFAFAGIGASLRWCVYDVRRLLALVILVFGVGTAIPAHAQRAAGTPPTLSCPVGTTLFDWDPPTSSWTAGSVNNSYTVSNIGSINFAITKTGGAWVTNTSYGGTAPFRQNLDTYGFSPAQYMLQEWIDFTTSAQTISTVITLPTAVPALQMSLFDVDFSSGGFADKVTVTGTFNGSPVTPTLTNGVTNYVTGNVAIGDGTSAVNSPNGRVYITFTSPVDTITIVYGNHTTAPANPSSQAIDIHDITFCRPQANLSLTKISSVISDPINLTTNPKAIPTATIRYCIQASNSGSATITNMVFSDPLPSATTYIAGTMRSGTSCATAATVEDDDSSDAAETDAIRASFSGTTLTATAATMGPSTTYAITFNVLVN